MDIWHERDRVRWLWVAVFVVAVFLALLAVIVSRAGAAPVKDYYAQNWHVNLNPVTCQDATVGGPMPATATALLPRGAAVQVLIYRVGSSQPVYTQVYPVKSWQFTGTVHLATPLARWYVLVLAYEGAPWLMINEEVDCFSGPLRVGQPPVRG